jgi:UDP-GlcNAc:undecaprenyl-phosphate/decaprenyl-phosphate GlcNAc-1-phosphate transferase
MSPAYLPSLIAVFAIALCSSLLLVGVARWASFRFGVVARPGGRRLHQGTIAKLGALPLWGAFTLTALIAQVLPVERADPNEIIRLIGLLGGGTFIFIFGLLDDKFDLSWQVQFIGQGVAALIGIACLVFIERINNPFTGETIQWTFAVTLVVTLFWLVLMMNTVNFLDGSDGLSGGVILIAAVLLFIHTAKEMQHSVSLLPMALIGTLVGFLVFNWHPAKIFMGSGSVYLGYVIGALSIIGGAKMATILLVMGLPLLDAAWQVTRRLTERRNPLKGDRGHIHFRLIDLNVSPAVLALGYHAFCAAFGVLALVTTSRQFKLVALVAMIVLVLVGFAFVDRRAHRRTPNKVSG